MKTVRTITTQLFFVLSLFLISSTLIQAETTNCTAITYLPYPPITTSGIYCLTSDLATNMTSGNAIEIQTNNVVIDLNGHKIGGLGAGPTTLAYGIHASQRQNITIRNGTVRGFYRGIILSDVFPYTTSQGHLIEDIRADMNTLTGIQVFGRGNIVRNNQVVATGGSPNDASANGIVTIGPDGRVLNNDVIETKEQSPGAAIGVYVISGPGTVVENNKIGNSSLGPHDSYGISIASSLTSSSNVLVSNNRVTTMNYGIFYDTISTGIYMNNLASGCTTPYFGGTAAGSTNYSN